MWHQTFGLQLFQKILSFLPIATQYNNQEVVLILKSHELWLIFFYYIPTFIVKLQFFNLHLTFSGIQKKFPPPNRALSENSYITEKDA